MQRTTNETIDTRDRTMLRALFEHAKENPGVGQARLSAMIHFKGSVSFIGVNSKKTDPLQKKYGKNPLSIHLHAEIAAIKLALKNVSVEDLSKATLYVIRAAYTDEKRSKWRWGLAKPCSGCTRAIEAFNIERVVYSVDSEDEEFEVWYRD